MEYFANYNIIPVGDHCAISIILKEINLRQSSYPFDWNAKVDPINETNIIENIGFITELYGSANEDEIVKKYIGNAFENKDKVNSNNVCFPHDTENLSDIFEKYKRRFIRLKDDLNKPNIFILLTRHYYIEEDTFNQIVRNLLQYNSDSKILFISGTDHSYIEQTNRVKFKYIEYDISKRYEYDYSTFRPKIKKFIKSLVLEKNKKL